MRLLIITQKIDKEDDVFGFFHGWLEKLALKTDYIHVICLQSGQYVLPPNVRVWSLGKENAASKIKYIFRFYGYIRRLRKNYDAVFVHMNPVYVILGAALWKLWKKKLYLWYNHKKGDTANRLAFWLADKVFYTSRFSFAAKFRKAEIMPAGVDTGIFKKDAAVGKTKNSVLFLGRLARVKNIHILIEGAGLMDRQGIDFVLSIVGGAPGEDEKYFERIKNLSKELEEKGKIKFLGRVANYKTPEIYNRNEVFVNLTSAGSFDKTILEAMSSQTLVIVSNKVLRGVVPDFLLCKEDSPQDLKNKIMNLFAMQESEKAELGRDLRNYVVQNHGLDVLINKLINEFKT